MKRLIAFGLGCAAVLALSTSARAQRGDSGSIIGSVYDQGGSAVKGVRVTITSPTQIGGSRHAYTNEDGEFRFSNLDPGYFELRAEAPKMRTFIQKQINVGINAPTEVNVVMEVASNDVEEVKVVQKAPLISTTTTSVKEVYDIDFVDSLPHDNRDVIFQQMPNYSAGVINGRIRGGSSSQSIYTIDGFNLFHDYPTVKASAAYETLTAGYGVDNVMAPGGVVNMVTKSGSNKFEFEMEGTWDQDKFRLLTDRLDSKTGVDFYILNPSFSGPIIKDRLWYAVNVEFLTQRTGRDSDPTGVLPDVPPELRNWYKGTVKLTWQVSSRNKLSSIFTFDEWWRWNAYGLGYTKAAQEDSISKKYFLGLIWESVLTDWAVFRSQVGFTPANTQDFPDSCYSDPGRCDFTPSIKQTYPVTLIDNNDINHDAKPSTLVQFVNRLEFFFGHGALGEHDLQLKDNLMLEKDEIDKSVPGDTQTELLGNVPSALTTYYSNDPRYEDPRFGWFITQTNSLRNAATISDSWRPTRFLTIAPGIAYTTVTGGNVRGDTVISGSTFAPSLSVAWDATHDGRTVLRGSFAEYLDTEVNAIAGQTLGGQVNQRCQWNDTDQKFDKSCVFSGGVQGATVGLPCGPSGKDIYGNDCHTKLTIPKTWEYTAGAEREVVEGIGLGASFVYRQYNNQYETLETNRIWNNAGTDLATVGGYRNGRAQTVSDLETPDGARRRYVGITASAFRREGRMKIQADYTWSRLDGTVQDGTNNLYGDIGPRDMFLYGSLPDDHRHEIKLNMSYHALRWLSFSARYAYTSGQPYSRMFYNSVTGKFENLSAPVGINPGTNINDPSDDRQLRLPDIQSLNAQVAFNLEPVIGQKLEFFVDWLNVLGLRTITAVTTNDGPLFGQPSGARMAPMRIRLGARYRY